MLTDRSGIPLGAVVAPANRHAPLLRPTLEPMGRFELRFGVGRPEAITVHLDASYDSARTPDLFDKLGCREKIRQKGSSLQGGSRRVVARVNSWHNRGIKKLLVCTESAPFSLITPPI